MTYFNPTPSQSTTLSPAERAAEARRLLTLLREEDEGEMERKLTQHARSLLAAKWLEVDLGGQLVISENTLLFLRDMWSRFA